MELPKIKNENLPKELKEILGDADAEFTPIVNPEDIINVELNVDEYYEGRMETAQMLIESREKLEQPMNVLHKSFYILVSFVFSLQGFFRPRWHFLIRFWGPRHIQLAKYIVFGEESDFQVQNKHKLETGGKT